MKILLYLTAGAGDLINFTGVVATMKRYYPDYEFDFLIKKKHAYILEEHPAINQLLFFDDYPHIPQHCTHINHDSYVHSALGGDYDSILGTWGVLLQGHDHHGDFALLMADLMRRNGFGLPVSRKELSPVFYYSTEDHIIVDKFWAPYKNTKEKVVLIEDQCSSWHSPQQEHQPGIIEWFNKIGWITVGNHPSSKVSIQTLNLKQVRLFFNKYGNVFLGLSSGMTCAMYARPNFFANKKLLVGGIVPGWNLSNYLDCGNNYLYMNSVYGLNDIKLFLGIDNSKSRLVQALG